MFKCIFSSNTNTIANNNNNNVTTSSGHSDSSKINPNNEQLVANPELNSTIDDFQSTSNVNPNFSSSLEPIFKTEEEPETICYNGTNLLLFPQNNLNADADTDIAMEEFIKFKDPLALDNNHDAVQQVEDETENIKDTAIEEEITEASTPQEGEEERFPQMPADVKFEIEQDNSVENEANFRNFFSQYRASLNLLYERH